ncbi:hypothetical protein MJ904_27595 [Massilia sp. MB5]|uniref:hypothetical protein n=1 Tax=Massilia sp. MB5 TaxID=2919578 RepID=UPI001F113BA6|nr:hypothetical protein [Massilia sp. MB5]UMR30670.1 hypothetical protein MJ904_27595 [Massilia sp. MB5]
MTNTAIQLSAELKAAIAEAAQRAGMSEHDYILAAIHQKLIYDDAGDDPAACLEADRNWDEFLKTGLAVPFDEVKDYWERRFRGEQVDPPKARVFKP